MRYDEAIYELKLVRRQRDQLAVACEKVLGVLNHGTPNPDWPHIHRIRAALINGGKEI